MGNIITGLDLIRRLGGADDGSDNRASTKCYGLTFPLLTKADGTKMGKTACGAVWLAAGEDNLHSGQHFLSLAEC